MVFSLRVKCFPCSQPAARGCRRRILCKPRCRTCSQMLLPPHSLQSLRRLPRSQMLLRAHSLHWLRLRPCSQHRCRRRTPCTPLVTTTADAFAAAVLAEVALPPVLAYAGATALIGLAAAPPVLAEAHSRPHQTRRTRRTRPNTPTAFSVSFSLFLRSLVVY